MPSPVARWPLAGGHHATLPAQKRRLLNPLKDISAEVLARGGEQAPNFTLGIFVQVFVEGQVTLPMPELLKGHVVSTHQQKT